MVREGHEIRDDGGVFGVGRDGLRVTFGRDAGRDLRPQGKRSGIGQASRVIVTGPLRLLHANYDKGAGVVFLRAAQQQGTSASDCVDAVPMGWGWESDLAVREGEAILCLGGARGPRVVARALGCSGGTGGVQHAMKD